MKRYKVDFWDAFDGWTTRGFPPGWRKDREFDDLEKAKEKCRELMAKEGPFGMDEHYGVIDLELNREVFCGKDLLQSPTGKVRIENVT